MIGNMPTIELLKEKFIGLLCDAANSSREDAILEVTGRSVSGLFYLELEYHEALCVLQKIKAGEIDEDDPFLICCLQQNYRSLLYRTNSKELTVSEACKDVIAEYSDFRNILDYVLHYIDAVKFDMAHRYATACSEAELLTLPPPEWPDIKSIQKIYRHTTTVD